MTELTRIEERMVENFIYRYRENEKKARINNADLPAGYPMYYYCRGCGVLVATLPEEHLNAPPKYCDDCEDLRKQALLDEALRRVQT